MRTMYIVCSSNQPANNKYTLMLMLMKQYSSYYKSGTLGSARCNILFCSRIAPASAGKSWIASLEACDSWCEMQPSTVATAVRQHTCVAGFRVKEEKKEGRRGERTHRQNRIQKITILHTKPARNTNHLHDRIALLAPQFHLVPREEREQLGEPGEGDDGADFEGEEERAQGGAEGEFDEGDGEEGAVRVEGFHEGPVGVLPLRDGGFLCGGCEWES